MSYSEVESTINYVIPSEPMKGHLLMLNRPNNTASMLGHKIAILILALLCMLPIWSCSNAIYLVANDVPREFWIIVVDGDQYLAYEATVSDSNKSILVPPPQGCNWHEIECLREFAHQKLWLPTFVLILPITKNERFLQPVVTLIREETKASATAYVALQEMPQSEDVQRFSEHLEATPKCIRDNCTHEPSCSKLCPTQNEREQPGEAMLLQRADDLEQQIAIGVMRRRP